MTQPMCSTFQLLSIPVWQRRIAGKYLIDPSTGCWEWTGYIDKSGYGVTYAKIGRRRRRYTGAHRASYIAHRGPIPDGLQIDHLCRNRRCINPDHLETVTSAENQRRSWVSRPASVRPLGPRPRVPLDERRGCAKHGKQEGAWRQISDTGRLRWSCYICHRSKWQRRKHLRKRKK